jgi:uncharacterized integral membrane protein
MTPPSILHRTPAAMTAIHRLIVTCREKTMTKFKRIVSLVIFVPLGIVLIVLAVANRQSVKLALNPFRPEDSLLSLTVLFGMALGSFVTWWSQGKHRRQARIEAREAVRLQKENTAAVKPSPSVVPANQAIVPAPASNAALPAR